jgi:hypothetical protein
MELTEDELAAIAAEGTRVATAIGPGSTRADSDADDTGNQMPFTVDGGKLTEAPETMTDMTDDFAKSDGAPAMIDGLAGATYTRTTGMVEDTVYSYTDQAAPTDQAYLEYYSNSNVGDRDAVSGATEAGVLTIDVNDIEGNHALFGATFGITGPHQSIPAPVNDVDTDVDEGIVSFKGTFHGIPGTFMCPTGCEIGSDKDSNLNSLAGAWTFTPDDVAEGADAHMVAGVIDDPDYLDFGYWLIATEDEGGKVTYAVLAFAEGNRDYGNVGGVEGTAEYAGPATGLYVKRTVNSDGTITPIASGQFTADAVLNASFGGPSVAEDTQFNISGSISDFRNSADEMIAEAWKVELMGNADGEDNIAAAGTFGGMTTGGGSYAGTFHGDSAADQPTAASGTFDAHFPNGDVLGAFGANKR